ncbi:DUF721 domain-containing protein [Geomonas sp. RF6]|uniref:DUF721 domain-containing protein n=1 Tax=Geomonas sp. RF6 TaxID=2897342 RepID=UPI001E4A65FC|nr:DUF721 domain-containing protein [Geomonas sp. RF6]UFS72712.1 DUF721 domain-containing protein [Geomonas sp. RF6]
MADEKRRRMYRPAPVSSLIESVFAGTAAGKRLHEGRIWEVWEEAVGKGIAKHATPVAFREGVLTLRVDSAPWMQQLTYLKKDLITKVNALLEEEMVQDIFLKAGQVKLPPAPPPFKPKRRQLTEAERAWVVEQAQEVTDPELRAVFENLIRKDLESR